MNASVQAKIYYNKLIRESCKLAVGKSGIVQDFEQIGAIIKLYGTELKSTFDDLINSGLIQQVGKKNHAKLTDDGIDYINQLEALNQKAIVLQTREYLGLMSGYKNINKIFDAVGVKENEYFRSELLGFLYEYGLIEPRNQDIRYACLSPKGKALDAHNYHDIVNKQSAINTSVTMNGGTVHNVMNEPKIELFVETSKQSKVANRFVKFVRTWFGPLIFALIAGILLTYAGYKMNSR